MDVTHNAAATVFEKVNVMKLSERRLNGQKAHDDGAESGMNVVKKLQSLGQHKLLWYSSHTEE